MSLYYTIYKYVWVCGNFPKTLENAQKHTCNTDIVYTSLQVAANAQLDKIVSTSTIIYVYTTTLGRCKHNNNNTDNVTITAIINDIKTTTLH